MSKPPEHAGTAGELLRMMEASGELSRLSREQAAAAVERRTRYRRAVAPMLEELAQVGAAVEYLDELRITRPPAAAPVLALWLPRVADVAARREIIGMLGEPWTQPHGSQALLSFVEQATKLDEETLLQVGQSLARRRVDGAYETLLAVAEGHSGVGRADFARALGRYPSEARRSIPVLRKLVHDSHPHVRRQAAIALRQLTGETARSSDRSMR